MFKVLRNCFTNVSNTLTIALRIYWGRSSKVNTTATTTGSGEAHWCPVLVTDGCNIEENDTELVAELLCNQTLWREGRDGREYEKLYIGIRLAISTSLCRGLCVLEPSC